MPEKDIRQHALERIEAGEAEKSARTMCPNCRRGAVELPVPTMEDADAIIAIRDHFDMYRRNFTPEMKARIDSMNRVIFYISSMNHGQP